MTTDRNPMIHKDDVLAALEADTEEVDPRLAGLAREVLDLAFVDTEENSRDVLVGFAAVFRAASDALLAATVAESFVNAVAVQGMN